MEFNLNNNGKSKIVKIPRTRKDYIGKIIKNAKILWIGYRVILKNNEYKDISWYFVSLKIKFIK